MITIRRSAQRGHANHGWLNSYHTFSFASYFDPKFMGFSDLRVINQDWVAPGQGFGTHGHEDMEIVTYVYKGTLEHKDSMGNGSRMRAGEVQLMSAGRGVTHSEFNPSTSDDLELLQMWILPAKHKTIPRYEQSEFPESDRRGKLRLVVSPDGRDGSLTIGQDVELHAGLLHGAEIATYTPRPGRTAWLHIVQGQLTCNGHPLDPGDGAAIHNEAQLTFDSGNQAEFLLWDLPANQPQNKK